MFTYIVRRLLYSIPVLIVASFLIFIFVTQSGDPLGQIKQIPKIDPKTVEAIAERKHLNDPFYVQYAYWVKDAVTNGFGTTLFGGEPILPDLKRVLGNTLQFLVIAEVIAAVLAILIGVTSAVKQYSIFDYTTTTLSFLGFSIPVFWLATLLQSLVTIIYNETQIRLFYTSGLSSPDPANFWIDRLQHLALPVLTIVVLSVAQYTRYLRASMLEVVNSDYVRTARAKGLKERRVVMKHALRNALIPFITVLAVDFGALFSGAIVTETIFGLDGMGKYLVQNLSERDAYPIMAWLMVTAILVIIFNLVADVLYGILDPRIRYD